MIKLFLSPAKAGLFYDILLWVGIRHILNEATETNGGGE